jgi:hypothetical protein
MFDHLGNCVVCGTPLRGEFDLCQCGRERVLYVTHMSTDDFIHGKPFPQRAGGDNSTEKTSRPVNTTRPANSQK